MLSAAGAIARVEPVELQPTMADTFSCSISLFAAMFAFCGSLSSSSMTNSTLPPSMPPVSFRFSWSRLNDRCSDWPSGAAGPDSDTMTPILKYLALVAASTARQQQRRDQADKDEG